MILTANGIIGGIKFILLIIGYVAWFISLCLYQFFGVLIILIILSIYIEILKRRGVSILTILAAGAVYLAYYLPSTDNSIGLEAIVSKNMIFAYLFGVIAVVLYIVYFITLLTGFSYFKKKEVIETNNKRVI